METTEEFKGFVDRIKACLRGKRAEGKQNPIITIKDIEESMTLSERSQYQQYFIPTFLNTKFVELIRSNPKIHFDMGRKCFSFKNSFESPQHMLKRLFAERIGVIEGEDLYDDIDKDKIEALKNNDMLRVIEDREGRKKNKPPTKVLFYGTNNTEDEVDRLNLEAITPLVLKDYWAQIDKSKVREEMISKHSAIQHYDRTVANRERLKAAGKRKRRNYDEENINNWKNTHIKDEIQEAMDTLSKRVPDGKKPLLKRTGVVASKPKLKSKF